ncbi:KAP family P-loop NTPase fold protein [Candidatus Electronema sp. TJ]|uniref:KAP family P-loop NTPase fold protein n=1 Tax=Candidatus Electronema sp. TJ TaxID=3401573 RepID=UPI003AA8EDDB
MKYKLAPLELPAQDPFQFDALNRKPSAKSVSLLVDELEGPFVLAIDSPWGTGKTTFVKMLMSVLQEKGYPCLYFDAWKTDFSADPMVAFLGEIGSFLPCEIKQGEDFQQARRIATVLAKKAVPVSAKLAATCARCLNAFERDCAANAVDEYEKERGLIEEFHAALDKTVAALIAGGKLDKLVIFIDEIDRCRPGYAVDLLECVKHLFDIRSMLFIMAFDKQQLQTSLGAVYGQSINSNEYLRRFIDLEHKLPKPDAESFAASLFSRFEFDKLFVSRAEEELCEEKENLVQSFTVLSEIFDLSLRAREQCFTAIRVAIMTTPEKHYFYPQLLIFPHLLTILAVLRVGAPEAYRRYALEDGSADELVAQLRSRAGGGKMLASPAGTLIEAYLIAAKFSWQDQTDPLREYKLAAQDRESSEETRQRAARIISIVRQLSFVRRSPSLSYIVNKLELAARFKR